MEENFSGVPTTARRDDSIAADHFLGNERLPDVTSVTSEYDFSTSAYRSWTDN
jgi:hypothetical protein